MKNIEQGKNCVIGETVVFKGKAKLGHNCIIEDGVIIGENTIIDSNSIIRRGVTIGDDSFVGSNCIIGEYLTDYCIEQNYHEHPLRIGDNALIRSGSIIYAGSVIGNNFQTGHQVTIREKSKIGNNVSIGTLSDIQGNCCIGDYVRMHSNVHIGQLSQIDSFVWIYPYVVLTNDPTPPSDNFEGVHVFPFAIIATSATIMPGVKIKMDSLIAAGATVTKDVDEYSVVGGSPAKIIGDVRSIKNHYTKDCVYPWRYYFDKYMPWKEIGFENWYLNLEEEEKLRLRIEGIENP